MHGLARACYIYSYIYSSMSCVAAYVYSSHIYSSMCMGWHVCQLHVLLQKHAPTHAI